MTRIRIGVYAAFLTVLAAIGLTATTATAGDNGTLSGVVVKSGDTVFALVTVTDAQTGAFVASTISNGASGFSLSLPAGVYAVSATDFDTSTSTFVAVSSGATTNVVLTLPAPFPLPLPFPF